MENHTSHVNLFLMSLYFLLLVVYLIAESLLYINYFMFNNSTHTLWIDLCECELVNPICVNTHYCCGSKIPRGSFSRHVWVHACVLRAYLVVHSHHWIYHVVATAVIFKREGMSAYYVLFISTWAVCHHSECFVSRASCVPTLTLWTHMSCNRKDLTVPFLHFNSIRVFVALNRYQIWIYVFCLWFIMVQFAFIGCVFAEFRLCNLL